MPPWSYSSLTQYETCPKQYHVIKVLKKIKTPMSEEMAWGNKVHKIMEERVRDGKPIPPDLFKWESLAKKLEAMPGEKFFEHEFAYNRNMFLGGWWDKDIWCRGKIDFWVKKGNKAIAYDYKTGKIKNDLEQLRLFAAFIMQSHKEIESVNTGYIWLADKKITHETFTREQLPKIWEDFTNRSLRLQASYDQDRWVPNPSGLCKAHCPVLECDFNWRK